MIYRFGFLLFLTMICSVSYAQLYFSPIKKGELKIGVFATPSLNLSLNSTSGYGSEKSAKVNPALHVGAFLQKNITQKFYVRMDIGLGVSKYAFKYHSTFASRSDTSFPKLAEESEAFGTSVFQATPQFSIGRYFTIRKKHNLDVNLGIAIPLSFSKNELFSDTFKSSSTVKYVGKVNYTSYSIGSYGHSNRNLLLDAVLYLGYKTNNIEEPLKDWSVGLFCNYTFLKKNNGYIDTYYYNDTYYYLEGKHSYTFVNTNIGIRVSYDLL